MRITTSGGVTAGMTALAVAGAVLVTAPAAEAAGRGITRLHGAKGHTVSIAKTLRPGYVHFRNTGKSDILIVRKKKAGTATFVKLFNSDSDSSERKALKSFDFIQVSLPKTDSWVKLPKGTYYFADGSADKFKASKIRVVTVKGRTNNAVVPYGITIPFNSSGLVPRSTAIDHGTPVRLVNKSRNVALGFVVRVKPTVTDEQVQQVVAHPTEKGLDDISNEADFSFLPAVVGPKHTVSATTTFTAGRYLLLSGAVDRLRAGAVGALTVR